MDATVGRVEDRVVSSTKGVIDDLEPYLAEETVPRIVDALMPYLVERVVPEVIDGLTERLATETGPAIVEGMTPKLADELVPVLLERMRPYLEAELVPAVVDGVTPHIIEKAGPQIVAGLMPYIQAEVVPEILDEFVDDPRVRDLIREQSLGLLWDAARGAATSASREATTSSRASCANLASAGPATEGCGRRALLPARPLTRRDRVRARPEPGIDLLLISLVAAQGLATALSLIGAVVDPIPKWRRRRPHVHVRVCSGRCTSRSPGGPSGRTIGGAIAGYAVVSSVEGQLGGFRSALSARSVSFFLDAAVGGRHGGDGLPPAPTLVGRPVAGLAHAVPRARRAALRAQPRPEWV